MQTHKGGRLLPKTQVTTQEKLILTHYMLSMWWMHLLDGLGHYIIHPGSIEKVLVMTNNITTLGYNYYKLRFKKPPEIFYKLSHTGWITT